jgi:CBS domain-containing protein
MDMTPMTLFFDDSFEVAVDLFNRHHRVNPVPVIDHSNKLVGVLSRFDLIKLLKIYGHS